MPLPSDPEIQQIISEVLARQPAENLILPPLVASENASALAVLLKSLLYTQGLDGSKRSTALGELVLFVQENLYLFMFILLFVVGWIVLLKWLKRHRDGWKQEYGKPITVKEIRNARDGLQLALTKGDYAEAMRWRWRMTLEQHDIFSALTPSEFVSQAAGNVDHIKAALPDIYRLMFSSAAVTPEEFFWFSSLVEAPSAKSDSAVFT